MCLCVVQVWLFHLQVMRDNEEVSQTLAQGKGCIIPHLLESVMSTGVTGVCEEVEEEDLLKELEALLLDDQGSRLNISS